MEIGALEPAMLWLNNYEACAHTLAVAAGAVAASPFAEGGHFTIDRARATTTCLILSQRL